jgi:hypothetical protein
MKQALEALEEACGDRCNAEYNPCHARTAITSLRQAIEQAEKQEPVAWIHTKIEGVTVPHRPADLDKHPDRWEALYKTPPPCPTCEALARTVMMDQTAHDLYTTPQPKREWVGLTKEDIAALLSRQYMYMEDFVVAVDAKLKEKNT